MFFVLMIQAASYLFIAAPFIGVAVGVATLVSDYRFNKSIGR
jgi:hypothetical protein